MKPRFPLILLITYFLVTYVIQDVLYKFVKIDTILFRHESPGGSYYISITLLLLLTFVVLRYRDLNFIRTIFLKISNLVYPLYYRLWVKPLKLHVWVFFLLSIDWFRSSLTTYRYEDVNISDNLSITLLLVVIYKFLFFLEIWKELVVLYLKGESVIKHKYLILVSMILTLTGTTSVLMLVIISVVIVFPKAVKMLAATKLTARKVLRFFLLVFILPWLLVYGFHVGVNIKNKENLTFEQRFSTTKNVDRIKNFLIVRFSTTFYVHTVFSETDYSDNIDHFENLTIPFQNALFRLNVLLGSPFDIDKPNYARVSQLNYKEMLLAQKDSRSGASTGLFPGFAYVFPYWLAIVVSIFYLAALVSLFDFISKPSWFLALASLLFLLEFFKSPVDLLNFVDPGFFKFLFFLATIAYIKKKHLLLNGITAAS